MATDYISLEEGGAETPNEPKRVARTGLAVVHEGEMIVPAVGSEAGLVAFEVEDRAVVVYYPVHVEVRMAEFDQRRVVEMIKAAFESFGADIDGTVVA